MITILASLSLLMAATVCDFKCGKIKNWITLPTILIAALVTIHTNPNDFWIGIIALGIWFLAGCIGISGWGDIKCCMALTLVNGWRIALFTYLAAQICLIAWHLVLSPKETFREIRCYIQNFLKKNVIIDNAKTKHIFAPYLLVGYLIQLLVSLLIDGGAL